MRTFGVRTTHSGRAVHAPFAPVSIMSAWKCVPSDAIDSDWIQKFKIGFDQNHPSCAHHREIQSSRERISRATSP